MAANRSAKREPQVFRHVPGQHVFLLLGDSERRGLGQVVREVLAWDLNGRFINLAAW